MKTPGMVFKPEAREDKRIILPVGMRVGPDMRQAGGIVEGLIVRNVVVVVPDETGA